MEVQQFVPSHNANPTPNTYKRHNMRLAQKATANYGKGVIEIAQNLIVKKLGDLAGAANVVSDKNTNTQDFDLYA